MVDEGVAQNRDYHRKIVDVDQLVRIVAGLRRPAPNHRAVTIVQCHGCFDIVHPGHIRYLEFARAQGDVLIVSITGDSEVGKGETRPYIPQELRAESLAALQFVDYVVIDANPTACALLQKIQPDVYVKGAEYATSNDPRFLAEREVIERGGGRVIFSSGQVVFSSTRLISKLPQSDELAAHRLALWCKRHKLDAERVTDLLAAMAGKRLLVVGDSLIERYVACDPAEMSVESPVMTLKELDSRDYLGGAAATAMLAAGMGAEVILVTSLDENDGSDWVRETLSQQGVRVRAVTRRGELPIRTRFLADDHKVFKVERGAIAPLDSIGEREGVELVLSHAGHADAAILYDGGYGMLTPGLLRGLGATFRRLVPIISGGAADAHGDITALRNVDLLCADERQLRVALNDPAGGLSATTYRLLQTTRAKRAIVTMGKRGLVAFDRRSHDPETPGWSDRLSSEYLPLLAPRVTDLLASGEALLAVSTLALCTGASLMQSAYLGCIAFALQACHLGVGPLDATGVDQWARTRLELYSDDVDLGDEATDVEEGWPHHAALS